MQKTNKIIKNNNKEGRQPLQHTEMINRREISRESNLIALFKIKHQEVHT